MDTKPSLLYAAEQHGAVCKPVSPLSKVALIILVLILGFLATPSLFAQDVNIQQSAGGITINGKKNARTTGFGNVNGLGIGTAVAGATILSTTGGVLYTSPIDLAVNGAGGGNPAVVGVFVSSNFAHSALLQAFSCRTGCTSAANYTAISLTSGLASDTPVIPSPGLTTNQTVTVFIGIFVSNQDGASGLPAGTTSVTDSVQLTYQTFNGANGQLKNTDILTLNNPNETLETALQLTLSPGTLNALNVLCNGISPSCTGTPNFTADFGAVDGLGISSGNGAKPISATGGTIYCATYNINPEFSSFSSSNATVKVSLTGPFAHPAVLQLDDSSASSCGSATSSSFTQITNTGLTISGSAQSFTSISRLLGLFVSNVNGAGAFTGSDTATLTFTMTVP